MKAKRPKSIVASEGSSEASGGDLPEPWSPQRKTELALRLPRGEPLARCERSEARLWVT